VPTSLIIFLPIKLKIVQLTHEENQFERKTFPITLVCDHIYFQQNIGSLFRISEAFGVENIIFFGKDIPLTPRKINKTSRSTHLHVAHYVIEDYTELHSYLTANNFEIIALEIASNSKPLKEIIIPENKKIALLIGSEINGVSNELLEISNQIVHINMFGKNSSMNVVQATSIALYEITSF
jgi:tRNA G18 (ribose-2'-O)-methylase SpoU